jgi:hypothetical protein
LRAGMIAQTEFFKSEIVFSLFCLKIILFDQKKLSFSIECRP